MKTVLEPLLEDFQYWFEQSRSLLESKQLRSLSAEHQREFLERVRNAQQEVSAAKSLFHATEGEIGVDMAAMAPWHQLVTECWQVSARDRQLEARSDAET